MSCEAQATGCAAGGAANTSGRDELAFCLPAKHIIAHAQTTGPDDFQAFPPQASGLKMRVADAGYLANFSSGRRGRASSSPPQFGQRPFSRVSAQAAQKVHSKEQMRASFASGGRSLLQHSQFGRSSSMRASCDGK
jgi:hypothetical protein